MRIIFSLLAFFLLLSSHFVWGEAPPNIVYILADDLGYGDVGCYNPESKIATPNMDQLAREGMRFTDMHSGSSVCTPTRYGILTGRYSWRTSLQKGVTNGYSLPLIAPDRATVATILKDAGYATACIGKWHLGLGWQTEPGKSLEKGEVDYSKHLLDTPIHHGFDYFFGISASLDMIPYVYLENDHVVSAPTEKVAGREGKELLREGPIAPGFKHEEVLPTLLAKATTYIEEQAKSEPKKPFFLYLPLTAPHTPILPTQDFLGKSKLSTYGDFVAQVDWSVGEIMKTLDKLGLAENTLIIVTSDNGFAPMADLDELKAGGHDPSYGLRGTKSDIFEGGHRIPFIARWPHKSPVATVNNSTFGLGDLMATVADILDKELQPYAAEDSYSMLPALLGEKDTHRPPVIHQASDGSLAIRVGDWKLILCAGSGGWSEPSQLDARKQGLPPVQLYNLADDLKETKNLYVEQPMKVEHLLMVLERFVEHGRSTSGPRQKNDLEATSMWGPGEVNKLSDLLIIEDGVIKLKLDSPAAVLDTIDLGGLNSFSYEDILHVIYSKHPSDEGKLDECLLHKSILISYLGILNAEKAIAFYDHLLTDEGLDAFAVDLAALGALKTYSSDRFKNSVMLSTVNGYAYMNTPESRAKLEQYLHNPLKYQSKENCSLNDTFESAVVSALALFDTIKRIGLDEYFAKKQESTFDFSNYSGMDKYQAIADEVKEDFSCE